MILFYSVIGFGLVNHTKMVPLPLPKYLQELNVKELDNQVCEKAFQDVANFAMKLCPRKYDPNDKISHKHVICTASNIEKNIADGDSGGPLLFKVRFCKLS